MTEKMGDGDGAVIKSAQLPTRTNESYYWSFNEKLFEDLDDGESYFKKRPLLAHYTTVQTFEAIVDRETVWFSNPLYMNDVEEVRWGILNGCNAYEDSEAIRSALGEEGHNHFRASLHRCLEQFETEYAFDTYVLCLSEYSLADPDGLLSMWRGYGDSGRGVAIVFDGAPLLEVPESPLVIAKVEYKSTADRLAWFESQATLFASLLQAEAIAGEALFFATSALFSRLRMAALFSKHVGFAEEREWRIAYLPEHDSQSVLKPYLGYHVGNRGVEPKLKLKIGPVTGAISDRVTLDSLVHTILLGPTHASMLPITAMRRMLSLKGHEALVEKVTASRIPFRPTGIQF